MIISTFNFTLWRMFHITCLPIHSAMHCRNQTEILMKDSFKWSHTFFAHSLLKM